MTFFVENETEVTFPFDTEEIVRLVAEAVLDTEQCPYETQVNVLLTNNEGIHCFNKQYRNVDNPTDVLSFPNMNFEKEGVFEIAEEEEADYFDPENGELILGDIIVSVDKVREQALQYGHSERREFAFLVAHSMFHLCGYDHMTEPEAKVMEEKQERILEQLQITRDK